MIICPNDRTTQHVRQEPIDDDELSARCIKSLIGDVLIESEVDGLSYPHTGDEQVPLSKSQGGRIRVNLVRHFALRPSFLTIYLLGTEGVRNGSSSSLAQSQRFARFV